jgi:hypothetical protein
MRELMFIQLGELPPTKQSKEPSRKLVQGCLAMPAHVSAFERRRHVLRALAVYMKVNEKMTLNTCSS